MARPAGPRPAARTWAGQLGPRPAPRCRGAHAAGGRSWQRALSRHDNSAGSAPPDRVGWSWSSPRRGLATDRTGAAAQELSPNQGRAQTSQPVGAPDTDPWTHKLSDQSPADGLAPSPREAGGGLLALTTACAITKLS